MPTIRQQREARHMAVITPMRTPAENALQSRFSEMATTLPGAVSQRSEAMAMFREKGLPHKRIEAWHYSDLRSAMRDVPPIAGIPDGNAEKRAKLLMKGIAPAIGCRIVLLDGYLSENLSSLRDLPQGLSIMSLASALVTGDKRTEKLGKPVEIKDNAAVWLNTAFLTDGIIIDVSADAAIADPIEIIHVVSGETATSVATRSLVLVGAGASATIVERQLTSAAAHQINSMIEFGIGKRAVAEHIRIDRSSQNVIVLSTLTGAVNEEASFSSFALQTGGGFVRHQPFMRYAGENAYVAVRGVNLLNGSQHADTTLTIDHAVPHGVSRELFRSVIDGEATGTFQGKIIVRQDAQKTDGQMASNAILLSDEATMNNKPELEIFADDVVCAHGATCGSLNDDQLFYLMARGLPKAQAEALLIEAFAGEVIDEVKNEAIQDVLRGAVAAWLALRSADPVI
jgi:Fe-S cluster assembly protein SufD